MKRFSIFDLSIQVRLPLIIFLLLLVIILLYSSLSYYSVHDAVISAGADRVKNLSEQLSTLLHNSAERFNQLSETQADDNELRSYLRNDQQNDQEIIKKKLISFIPDNDTLTASIQLVDDEAKIIAETNSGFAAPESFRKKFESSLPISITEVGKFYNERDSIFYPVIAPVKSKEKILGYVIKWRILHTSQQALNQLTELLGSNSNLYLSNNDGTAWNNLMQAVENPPVPVLVKGNFLEYERNGENVLASARLIPGTPWAVLVEISKDTVTATADYFFNRSLVVGILLLLVGLTAAWILSRNITKPLKKLTSASENISAGDYSALVKVEQHDELGKLANAFNTMVIRVRDSKEHLENKVHERTMLLKKANAELEDLNRKLQDLDRVKTNFFTNVSHELRTPLTLILGPVEKLISSSRITEENKRDLFVIQQNARILLKHVNNLLDLSRIEVGEMKLDYANMNLTSNIKLIASYFESLALKQNIKFELNLPERLSVQADPEKIERIMINLLSNAFKYTPNGGKITCTLSGNENNAIIEIKDTGPGIDKELLNSIFNRYQIAQKGLKRTIGSTGLGLSIVKEFVDLHNGHIEVYNADEGGAVFRLSIPVSAPEGVVINQYTPEDISLIQEELKFELVNKPSSQFSLKRKQKMPYENQHPLIVVIEDNIEMNNFITEILSESYRVVTAFDGVEGLQKIREHNPDLILTDIMMPDLNGDAVLDAVKADQILASTPIILLTAKADDQLKIELLKKGASDYLSKPFTIEELKARVSNAIKFKLAKDVLQRELQTRNEDIISLLNELMQKKHLIEAALDEKNLLLKELHHRVKNNLQVILSLLNLQAMNVKDTASLEALTESKNRISSMALVHEKLYKAENAQRIDFEDYVEELVQNLISSYNVNGKSITTEIEMQNIYFRLDTCITLGLIISEVVTNSLKYAFNNRDEGKININLQKIKNEYTLSIKDDGEGLPHDFDPENSETLGVVLIHTFVEQLEGRMEINVDGGTEIKIYFTELQSIEKPEIDEVIQTRADNAE